MNVSFVSDMHGQVRQHSHCFNQNFLFCSVPELLSLTLYLSLYLYLFTISLSQFVTAVKRIVIKDPNAISYTRLPYWKKNGKQMKPGKEEDVVMEGDKYAMPSAWAKTIQPYKPPAHLLPTPGDATYMEVPSILDLDLEVFFLLLSVSLPLNLTVF